MVRVTLDTRRIGGDVVGALVVGNQNGTARNVVRPVGMRRQYGARAHADREPQRETGTPCPRPVAEHQTSLASRRYYVKHCQIGG